MSLGARWIARTGVFLVLLLCSVMLTQGAAKAQPLRTGFTDSVWFGGGPTWVQKTTASGARVALLEVDWTTVEPMAPPAGGDPADPSGPEYRFAGLDAAVREFAGTGVAPAFLVSDAPGWAEAPGGPAALEAVGAWRPSATAFGQLAAALARRYSGSYPDPLDPSRSLPRVRYFQAWAEANFTVHLAPQWTRSGRHWAATGPGLYRTLLNAFFSGIKSVHSDNVVITTGFGPYGDPPGPCPNNSVGNGCRMRPAMFARELLCLSGRRLRPERCPAPAHFDAMAMDPYEIASPTTRAYNADDISSPDLGKLTRILRTGVRLHRALPARHKQLWVTEFSYDSRPPNPGGLSLATQARWLDEAFYLFWKQGVSTAIWYLIRDQAPTYDSNSYYSGVYSYSGQPKPSLTAFEFPFVVWPSGKSATVWGISPASGTLAVQRKRGASWRTLFRLHASAGQVFVRHISSRLRGSFRATVDGRSSLAWRH